MDIARVLALYDAEVRGRPQAQPGFAIERVGGLALITGPFNFVSAWDLTADTAPAVIAAQAARFRARGESLLWRVHEHDGPPGLVDLLAEARFTASETTTLMILDLTDVSALFGGPADVEVRRVATVPELDGLVGAEERAFGEAEAWRKDAYSGRLNDPDLGLYVAYVEGEPVASARLELSPAWSFGLLQGGGVAPEYRGRGLYRALTAARVAAARERGLSYLVTDARETSRPILERLGFAPAVRAALWVLQP